jgi:hypothetical protein
MRWWTLGTLAPSGLALSGKQLPRELAPDAEDLVRAVR